jgi:arylsulfatase A
MKKTALVIAAIALLFAANAKEKNQDLPLRQGSVSAQELRRDTQDRPNILFILADDMGYGDLSSYGAEKIQTPNIDKLAEQGVRFTDAHTECSTCTPTRYGLLTGRYSWRTWLKYSSLSMSAPLLIEEGRMTIPSLLKSAGYSTSIVGKWHLGFGREEGFGDDRGDVRPNAWATRGSGPNWNGELKSGPLECGFDYSYVLPVANSFPPYVIVENHYVEGLRKDSPIGEMESKNSGKMEGGEGARWKDEELVDKFTSKMIFQLEGFAKENASTGSANSPQRKPFFLYYAPHQPHIPHRPNARFKRTSQVGDYGDVIQELDWSVGEVLKALERLGFSENTLVIFSSDNGAGQYGRPRQGHYPCGPLRGGKGDVTEGGFRVPLLARWPGIIKPGTRSAETISLTDMMATIAALTGQQLPEGAGPDSYNVLPALLGKKLPDPDRPIIMVSGGTGAFSIRSGKWKLIDGQGDCGYGEFGAGHPVPEPKPGDPPMQLYNLEEDLGENNNLYNQHPEIVQRLKQTLKEIKAAKH